MPYYCTVPRCTSMAGKAKNVSFHQFPRDEELANLWNEVLKRGKPYTKYSKVCSLHFKPEDYTITSVGKNKGQWRTLRKDAIPSQNLPSDSPPPMHRVRRQSSYTGPIHHSSVPTAVKNLNHSFDAATFVNMMPKDMVRSYEMAQAIYMQTMLAMQTAHGKDPTQPADADSPHSRSHSPSSSHSDDQTERHTNRHTKPNPDTITNNEVTLKCDMCLKLFKDPDVFVLHKRTHTNSEKENLICNLQSNEETLRSNPILANLLKAGIRPDSVLDENNILSIENQIMAALTSNIENYIRNVTSLMAESPNTSNQAEVGSSNNCDSKLNSTSNSDALTIDEAV